MRPFNLFAALCVIATTDATIHKHRSDRAKILLGEETLAIGGNTKLTDKEEYVNNCLMRLKFKEVDDGFDKPEKFNISRHYFTYKDRIRESKVYRIIKDMPKGAALHVHDMALMKPDYLVNITYKSNLYVCFQSNILFRFAHNTPNISCTEQWQLMKDARFSSGNVKKFDAELRKRFTMVVDNPDEVYPTIKEAWDTFLNYFATVYQLISYRPVWEKYFYDALKSFKDDNLIYLEVRSILPILYEMDDQVGETFDPITAAKAYNAAVKQFVKDNPDFLGAKLIYAPSRKVDREQLAEYLKTAMAIKANVPKLFAGFDLVGPEDRGNPLIEFVPQLQAASKKLNYFFHAGETDWYGTTTDGNLIDAILLGAKRLGHAYALTKHPLLIEEVRNRNIGVEVNVISNNVLSLVRDVRNHPLASFIAQGLPVVISSDDPGIWEADPISHDFYVAFVGVASRLSDLRLLKTFAINSLKYSALNDSEKVVALQMFDAKWNEFVDNFNCSRYF